MTTISQRELRNDSGAIMRRVEQGERFTVTRNGTPIADLVPHDGGVSGPRSRFVPVERIAAATSTLPGWGSAEGDRRELDALAVDDDRDPWHGR